MNRIMNIIEEITHGTSFNSFKFSYDAVNAPKPDYDDFSFGTVIGSETAKLPDRKNLLICVIMLKILLIIVRSLLFGIFSMVLVEFIILTILPMTIMFFLLLPDKLELLAVNANVDI
ncbi:MAG: hypothetical protein LBD23_17415 [Oscillospiraceae bacterium]|nr:hypothetical protein [Oscillospiraceae bacterium]